MSLCIYRNVYQSTTASSHIINGNPAYVSEDVYDKICEAGGKTSDVPAKSTTLTPYERLVFGVRGIRPVSMYPSDIDAPWATDNYYNVP